MAPWFVYIVRCGNGSLYTGVATDVTRRLTEHQANGGRGARYLRGRGPLELVLEREVGDRGRALKVEGRIKRLPKGRKEQLLRDDALFEHILTAADRGSIRRQKDRP